MTIPENEPEFFIAGDTVKWRKSLPEYRPADGWTLRYDFVKDGDKQSVTATDGGDGSHLVTISASQSADFTPGIYHWQATVSDGTDRYTVATGRIEVKPDFVAVQNGYDARSHVRKVLDALEATILGKASKDQMSYTIAGRSLARMSPGELLKWKNHYETLYRQEIAAEKLANGERPAGRIMVRF